MQSFVYKLKNKLRMFGRLPFLDSLIKFFVRNIRKKYRNEILLLEGKLKSSSKSQSILFFTVPKSASVFAGYIFRELARKANLIAIDFSSYFAHFGNPSIDFYQGRKVKMALYKEQGYFYGPLREFLQIPNLEKYKIMLMLRDPRDVLTSFYFSICYSLVIQYHNKEHAQEILDKRKEILRMSIDEAVLKEAPKLLSTYTVYCNELIGKPNVLFLKYEEMFTNFKSWLAKAITLFDIPDKEKVVADMVEKHRKDFIIKREDKFLHKRKGTPGDYKEKLKPETIQKLNLIFKSVLEKLGYPIYN